MNRSGGSLPNLTCMVFGYPQSAWKMSDFGRKRQRFRQRELVDDLPLHIFNKEVAELAS